MWAAVLVPALGIAGCQLISGVQTDGELRDDASSASAGGSTSASTTTVASTSVSSSDASSTSTYMGPVCGGTPCPYACENDVCIVGDCTTSQPFDIFTASDVDNAKLDATIAMTVSNSNALIAVVDANVGTLYARDVDGAGVKGAVLEHLLAQPARIDHGRFGGLYVAFGGMIGGEVAELRVDYQGGGDAMNPVPYSYGLPAPCVGAQLANVHLTESNTGDVFYMANCSQTGVSFKLVMGRDDGAPAELVDSAMTPDWDLLIDHYAVVNGQHLVLTAEPESGQQPSYRAGATAAQLATPHPFRLSPPGAANPQTIFLAPLLGNMQLTFGWYGGDRTASGAERLDLWSGTFADPGVELAATPPVGSQPLLETIAPPELFKLAGTPGQPVTTNDGVFVATKGSDSRTVTFAWMYPDGGPPLVRHQTVYAASDTVKAVGVAPLGGGEILVAWVEVLSAQEVVRGVTQTCTTKVYVPPP